MYSLKLYFDELQPGAKMDYISCQHTVCYLVKGDAVINGETVSEDNAIYCQDYVDAKAGSNGATIWRWELERTSRPSNPGQGEGVDSILKMARQIGMFKLVPTAKWMFRLDCIYNCEGCTGLHSHPGSGIRAMVSGHMKVESNIGEIRILMVEAFLREIGLKCTD